MSIETEFKRMQDEIDVQKSKIRSLREALQDVMAAHANDNVRPKAFYIAANAFNASLEDGK